jgi:transmembrane sensor
LENTDQISILFQKYLNHSCSEAEVKQLLAYFDTDVSVLDNLAQLVEDELTRDVSAAIDPEVQQMLDDGFQRILTSRSALKVVHKNRFKPVYRNLTIAAAVCAAVLLLFFYPQYHKNNFDVGAEQADFKPGTEKAVLMLEDGRSIDLASVGEGALSDNNGISVNKTADGKLVYQVMDTEKKDGQLTFNTLSTPKGGQYRVVLPDGSAVWLNAASSLTFPRRFSAIERRVALKGEGYFEIAKLMNKKGRIPFIVESRGQQVEVLGTHFNINAYPENSMIKTNLLEGSVKLIKGKSSCMLIPGEQASIDTFTDRITVEKNADPESVIAWKNGKFSFDEANIKDVMQQISRWYDVEVFYKGDFSDVLLSGDIARSENANQILKLLKGTHQVDFIVSGRTITVIPYQQQ